MSVDGLLLSLDENFINRENLLVFYDWAESGSIINKAPNYTGLFSGILSGSQSFYYASGVTHPQSDFVSISNTGDFYSEDFSHFFVMSRTGSTNDNFFSSLAENSGTASGYAISSNDAGKLVFSFKDCTGPQAINSDFSLYPYSNFAVVKRGNLLSLYQYVPVFNQLQNVDGSVNAGQIFPSDYADLFYGNQLPAGFIKDYFSGFSYSYLYFNTPLSTTQVLTVFSGLYTFVVSNSGFSGGTSGDYYNLPSGGTSGTSGIAPSPASLVKNGIVLLRDLPVNAKLLLDYSSGVDGSSWGNQAFYDFHKQNFFLNEFSDQIPVIYFNGQRLLSGISQITGQFCLTGRAFERDYQMSGRRQIFDAINYNENDTVVYDYVNNASIQNLYSGTGSVNINTGSGIALYFNGQRINDYSISGTSLALDIARTSGDIIAIDYYTSGVNILNEVYTSGFFYSSGAFGAGTSRLYMNGERLLLDVDYLEISSGTKLLAPPIVPPNELVVSLDNYSLWNL